MPETDTYLLRFSGELGTKARQTRRRFSERLAANVEEALLAAGLEFQLDRQWSRLFVTCDEPAALPVLRRVFGLQSVSPATARPWRELDDIVRHAVERFTPEVRGRRFAVRARRTTGRPGLPFDSPDLERAVGAALLAPSGGVDLDHPEVTAGIEVHTEQVYLYTEKLAGTGGMPLGIEGRALALVSGGFDSAVAAWETWKRGVGLDFVFFNLGGREHERGAAKVVEQLVGRWAYGDWPRLHAIDLRPHVEALEAAVKPRYWQLVLKALMYRAADALAGELRLPALVTGEAIGQVSSQTLPNLVLLDGVIERPVLRPLLTWNKEDIVAAARAIGTYELSATVPEFCALAARHAMTQGSPGAFKASVATLDGTAIARAVAARRVTEPRLPRDLPAVAGAIEAEKMPGGATIVDLRPRHEYRAWHWPGAVHLEYFQALRAFRSFDAAKRYVLYCEVGLKSAHLAELMQAEGMRAQHVPAGALALRRAQEAAVAG